MKPRVRHRFQFHLDTGRTVEGVLLDSRGGFFSLADVRVEGPDGKFVTPQGVGETHVPRDRVLFLTGVAS